MRDFNNKQMELGEIDPSNLVLDFTSRDDIPQILLGLKTIYSDEVLRKKIITILDGLINDDVDKKNGRPGMHLWTVFVLGTLRVNLNIDYDRLKELSDKHMDIRKMIGLNCFYYKVHSLQTIKDNVRMLTPEILNQINLIVVNHGHEIISKKQEILTGKCDSFVVKTNVHFPTDISLLYDATRKSLEIIGRFFRDLKLSGYRQNNCNIKKIKNHILKVQRIKRSTSRCEKKRAVKDKEIEKAYKKLLKMCRRFIPDIKMSINELVNNHDFKEENFKELHNFLEHVEKQIDQIDRRVLKKEKIPHKEKNFFSF